MTSSTTPTSREKRRRRLAITRLAIAGVAVLGVGAALTSAAWTDQAWFTTQATAGKVELYGSLTDKDGKCPPAEDGAYQVADELSGAVEIPLAPFEKLVPGDERTVTICLWNGSDGPLSVSLEPIKTDGDPVFGDGGAKIEVRDGGAPYATQTLAVNDVKPVQVVVSTPSDWKDSFQGAESKPIAITFTGSTDA